MASAVQSLLPCFSFGDVQLQGTAHHDCTDSQRNTRTQRLAQDDSCRHTPGCQQGHRLYLKDPFSLVFLGSGSYTQHSIMHANARVHTPSKIQLVQRTASSILTDTPAASTCTVRVRLPRLPQNHATQDSSHASPSS